MRFGPSILAALAISIGVGCGGSSDDASSNDDAATDSKGGIDTLDAPANDSGVDTGHIDAHDTGGVIDAHDAIATDVADTTPPPSSVPTDPISYKKDDPFTLDSGTTNYVYVPSSYDDTHETPITLFVWLHGCGGMSSGDIWVVSPGGSTQTWISLAVGGAEGACWNVDTDTAKVLAALADIKTHFNIEPKGVVLGGYSSGGDLTYRTAFYHAELFAGVLVMNSSPYRDTGSTESASLAAAAWKFNAVHVAHLQDTTYPIAGVRTETDSMTAAGFPMKRIEVDGGHWDDPGAIENGHPVPGTDADLATYLFPYLSAGWTAP
jgi:pimeloyl-ACP methyl ester carboxylesterase